MRFEDLMKQTYWLAFYIASCKAVLHIRIFVEDGDIRRSLTLTELS